MRLVSLSIRDFRNLEQVEIAPSSQATIAVGRNGQGKTNLLEALYFLMTLKPLRAGKLVELIRHGTQRAQIEAELELFGARRKIGVVIEPGARQVFVDGKKAASLEEYFGGTASVAFTPDDLATIKGSPEGRRVLVDRAVFNRFPAFLKESRAYARALKSRNRLLKDRAAPDYLKAYDEALAKAGARVWTRRRALLEEIAPRATLTFDSIGRAGLAGTFQYSANRIGDAFHSAPEERLEEMFREEMNANLSRDLDRGFSTVGPHTDDLEISLGEHPARSFASQGQQRALILAWKIAEIENLETSLGRPPLLLLDDVSSELDRERNEFLMQYLARSGAQVFLTTTEPSLVQRATGEAAVWYQVEAGQVHRWTQTATSIPSTPRE